MKNLYFLSLLMTLFFVPKTYGQLTSDNFESYPYGAFDLNWNANNWDGWDGFFSNATISSFAFSGNKSLAIVSPSSGVEMVDIMGLLPVLNSDLVTISFMQYIPVGSQTGLGLTHNYGIPAAEFSTVLDMNSTQGTIQTDGNYNHFNVQGGQWAELRFELDYVSDTAFFYYGNQMVTSWKLRNNRLGDIATANQINGINFYTPLTFACEAYYDDISVVQYAVSTKEVGTIKAFNVFPNPATDQINIDLGLEKEETIQYELTDISGKIVDNWEKKASTQETNTRNISKLANGIYILKVTAGVSSKVKKIVVNR